MRYGEYSAILINSGYFYYIFLPETFKKYRKSMIGNLLDVFGINIDSLKLFEQLYIMCICQSSAVCIQYYLCNEQFNSLESHKIFC